MRQKKFRAVLWDYAEGSPGGGGPDSTLSYDQLPKTGWFDSEEKALLAGRQLNQGGDFHVRIETSEPGGRVVVLGPSGVGKTLLQRLFPCPVWTPYRVRDPRPGEEPISISEAQYESLAVQRHGFGKPLHDEPGLQVYRAWSFMDVRGKKQCLQHTLASKDPESILQLEVFAPVLLKMLQHHRDLQGAFSLAPNDLLVFLLNPTSESFKQMTSPSLELQGNTRLAVTARFVAQFKEEDAKDIQDRVQHLTTELEAWRALANTCPHVVEFLNWQHQEYRYIVSPQKVLMAARETILAGVAQQAPGWMTWVEGLIRTPGELMAADIQGSKA